VSEVGVKGPLGRDDHRIEIVGLPALDPLAFEVQTRSHRLNGAPSSKGEWEGEGGGVEGERERRQETFTAPVCKQGPEIHVVFNRYDAVTTTEINRHVQQTTRRSRGQG